MLFLHQLTCYSFFHLQLAYSMLNNTNGAVFQTNCAKLLHYSNPS